MSPPASPSPFGLFDWMDVGEPPRAVTAERMARVQHTTPILAAISGAFLGPLAGVAAVALWPGAPSWALTARFELFAAVAILVGIAEYWASLRFFPWIASASMLHVRRVAIDGSRLRIEPAQGQPFDRSLAELRVSDRAAALDWYQVELPGGSSVAVCYLPGAVIAKIRATLPPKSKLASLGHG